MKLLRKWALALFFVLITLLFMSGAQLLKEIPVLATSLIVTVSIFIIAAITTDP